MHTSKTTACSNEIQTCNFCSCCVGINYQCVIRTLALCHVNAGSSTVKLLSNFNLPCSYGTACGHPSSPPAQSVLCG